MLAPSASSWFMMGMALASLMSSVSGLKAKPRMAMFLSFRLPSWRLQNSIALRGWVLFMFSTSWSSFGL